ncbi:MAG: PepSY-like domain-containing protein [Paramuribaculum sp.]|nr:PepSY-like domain-containing protein [Paramuribaculum sp.]
MKRVLLILAVIAGVFSASARDNYSHDVNILPAAAKADLKKNFKAQVSHIKIDKEWGRISEYDVVLTDGSEITYDRSGNWKDVEMSRNRAVPAAYIPAAIASFVNQNQKKAVITGIEKNKSGYEVELSNGIDMKFNSAGKFLRYDN